MWSSNVLGKRKRAEHPHPYLTGNFAPIQQTCPLTPCTYVGTIPSELLGGQYVRNGSNPVANQDLGRETHWFDGDGMLSGVLFKRLDADGQTVVQPEFVNQYILTDVFLSSVSTSALRKPILPSIATLVNPLSSFFYIILSVLRTILLVILSRLPGSKQVIKKISVANTAIIYHDGRALATCESGPPLRVALPSLDTMGWFDGNKAEGEPPSPTSGQPLGGDGLLGFMREWTTAHPKVDPETNEMILFHSTFIPPYVHYSILPATQYTKSSYSTNNRLLNCPLPGVSSAKMMHDFGVSRTHTVIMDLPLSLDPFKLLKNRPPIMYDATKPSRFGIFPRHNPSEVRWFQTAACCIFHTANTWDVFNAKGEVVSVDMLACRMTSASVVFSAGNIAAPQSKQKSFGRATKAMLITPSEHCVYDKGPEIESNDLERMPLLQNEHCRDEWTTQPDTSNEEEQCRLYYYSFSMESAGSEEKIVSQFALSAIPFEFPSVRADKQMSAARYIFGCTTSEGSFNSALGSTARIDALVKFDAQELIAIARSKPPGRVTGCVDVRSVKEIIASSDRTDPIQIFQAPRGYLAQEPRFAASSTDSAEDGGFLLTYMFDEAQLGSDGHPPPSAVSELWIIDAKGMSDVLAKVHLPQRVPYGLHGSWFPEQQVVEQRPIVTVRQQPAPNDDHEQGRLGRMGQKLTNGLIKVIRG